MALIPRVGDVQKAPVVQLFIAFSLRCWVLQNELLTYLGYLNLRYTLRGLGVIQKFNNNDNDD